MRDLETEGAMYADVTSKLRSIVASFPDRGCLLPHARFPLQVCIRYPVFVGIEDAGRRADR